MSLWSWLGRRIGLTGAFDKFWATFSSNANDAGEIVNNDRTMGLAAYARGVRLWGQTISTLPLNIYRQPARGGDPELVRDANNPYDAVCRISPNENDTPTEFWEAIIAAERGFGNGFARKHRAGGRVISLEILDPESTCAYRKPDGALFYKGVDPINRQAFDLPASEIFHLKGFSFGGPMGLSPVQLGANSIGNLLAANKASGRMLRSGLASSGFLETGQVLNDGDRARLKEIMESYAGSDNAGKLMILEGGMKFSRLSMSAADAQLLMQIGFGIEEVARILDIPPILLGYNPTGQTMWGTGVESIIGAWYTLGLRAELKRIETAINKRLIEPKDRGVYFAKFNVDGLLRGDSAAQAALFSAAAQNGWLTRNEIRKLLDLPPMPGGDELTVQVNMALLRDIGSKNTDIMANARNALIALLGLEDLIDKAPPPAPAVPQPAAHIADA